MMKINLLISKVPIRKLVSLHPENPGSYNYCDKQDQRLSVSVCIYRKCSHLRENEGEFSCKFVGEEEKRIRREAKK